MRACVGNLKTAPLAKRMERLDLFENSNELRKFKGILTREMGFIATIVDLFKAEISRLVKISPNFLENAALKVETSTTNSVDTAFF